MQDLKLDFTYCFKQVFAWCSRFARENALSNAFLFRFFLLYWKRATVVPCKISIIAEQDAVIFVT